MLRALAAYPWPGNVREMQNVIERAVAVNSTGRIGLEDLPPEIVRGAAATPEGGVSPAPPPGLDGAVAALERELIEQALRDSNGVKARAAKLLGISERNLWYKLKKYGIV